MSSVVGSEVQVFKRASVSACPREGGSWGGSTGLVFDSTLVALSRTAILARRIIVVVSNYKWIL